MNEVKAKAGLYSVQLDGWTDVNGEYLINVVEVISGYAYYSAQETPQGVKCNAEMMLETCKATLEHVMCAGFTADNCNGMQDLKAEFIKMAEKLKHVVFYANCMWHGLDSIGGALIGLGSAAEAQFILGPLDMTKKSSLLNGVKGVVKVVNNRNRLRGTFRELQRKVNSLATIDYADAVQAAKQNGTAKPPVRRALVRYPCTHLHVRPSPRAAGAAAAPAGAAGQDAESEPRQDAGHRLRQPCAAGTALPQPRVRRLLCRPGLENARDSDRREAAGGLG